CNRSCASVVSWNLHAVDVCFVHGVVLAQHGLNVVGGDVFALPAKGVAQAVGKCDKAIRQKNEQIPRIKVVIALSKGIDQHFGIVLSFVNVAIEFGHFSDFSDHDAGLALFNSLKVSVFIADELFGVGIHANDLMPWQQSTDASFAVD